MRCQDIPIAWDKDKASLPAGWLTGVQKSVVNSLLCLILKETLLPGGGGQDPLMGEK